MSEKTVNTQNTCSICNDNTSKYCCPRCEIYYCSLDCYKSEKHLQCSENFYRDCVNEELSSLNADDESRRKMLEILNRMRNESGDGPDNIEQLLDNTDDYEDESIDSDDNEDIDLHERIKDLNLDDPNTLWNALTEDEKNEFEALIRQGNVASLIPQWEPWWMYKKEKKLIQDVENKDNEKEQEAMKKCPPIKKVPKLSSLTTVQPSPAIKFNIANVLASYAFIMRYFNGEVDPLEVSAYVLSTCGNLDHNSNFEDFETAVEAVAQQCLQSDLIETDTESLDVLKSDTYLLLQGPSAENNTHYTKVALSHLHSIFSSGKTSKKSSNEQEKKKIKSDFSKKFPEHTSDHLPNIDVAKRKRSMKKIEYYLSYIETYGIKV